MSNQEIVQNEALQETLKHKRCGLGISMGVGKTRVAIKNLIQNYNPLLQVLVVAPKRSIFKSWIDELDKLECAELIKHITFSTYLSINKHNPNDFDIVYLDECHSLLENHENFLSTYTGKIVGLTGTPPKRRTSEKYRMVQKYCPIVYEFSVDEATDSDILNNYKIIVHELMLSKLQTLNKKTKDGGNWYTSEYKDYEYFTRRVADAQTQKQKQFASIMRMRGLMEYKTKEEYMQGLLKNIGQKCIIFANTHKQADRVCKHSYHSGNKSSDENLQLFSDGRIDKLSCVLQLSEGVSIPGLQQGIIMHAYGNERKTAQRIGRLLRLNPTQTATCHILCYKGSVDEKWVTSALSGFDSQKIKYFNPLNPK
jgi:superfamily II DNA or RNA helicase